MKLKINKPLRDELELEERPLIEKELKNYNTGDRNGAIKATAIITCIIIAVICIIFVIHYMKNGTFDKAYLNKHFMRFLIAEAVFVGIPVFSDIFMNRQNKMLILEDIRNVQPGNITYEVTSDALIKLENDKEAGRYLFEDIGDIRKEGSNVVFTVYGKEKRIADCYIPSLYRTLKEALDKYIPEPRKTSTKKVIPKKLRENKQKYLELKAKRN